MLTVYDYSYGTDYEDIESAIQWIHHFMGNATALAVSEGLSSHRGYIVGNDHCRRDRYGVFINQITVGDNFKSVGAAIAFIRDFIVRRRERAESGESYDNAGCLKRIGICYAEGGL